MMLYCRCLFIFVSISVRITWALTSKSSRPSLSSFISGMASTVMGSTPNARDVDRALDVASLVSWEELTASVRRQQTLEDQSFRQNLEKGYGVGSPLHRLRLFHESNKEEDVRVVFYRDSASWCKSL